MLPFCGEGLVELRNFEYFNLMHCRTHSVPCQPTPTSGKQIRLSLHAFMFFFFFTKNVLETLYFDVSKVRIGPKGVWLKLPGFCVWLLALGFWRWVALGFGVGFLTLGVLAFGFWRWAFGVGLLVLGFWCWVLALGFSRWLLVLGFCLRFQLVSRGCGVGPLPLSFWPPSSFWRASGFWLWGFWAEAEGQRNREDMCV